MQTSFLNIHMCQMELQIMIYNKDIIVALQKITISLLLILYFSNNALKASDKKQQLVLEIYPQWYSDDDYSVQGNIGIEKVFESDDWIRYYIKPSLSYALDKNWALHGGLGIYYTNYQENSNNVELRPYQGISYSYPFTDKWKLNTYFRAEERFQDNKEDSLRLRMRVRATHTMNPLSKENSWHKFSFGLEGFKSYHQDDFNMDSVNTYDHESHLSVAIERSLKEQNKVRFELMWKYQSPPRLISDSSANTVYFKIQYYPMWGKKWANRLNNQEIDQQ